jgi:CrcB protein
VVRAAGGGGARHPRLAIGVLAGLLASTRLHLGEVSRTFLIVGVLGGFTTFSSYSLDSYTLIRSGQTGLALVNAAGQVIVGLAALAVGFAVASWRP